MDIRFSSVVTMEHKVILEMLVSSYSEEFRLAFPDVQVINKMHQTVHYGQIIREQGPPMRYWCTRYEAYHNVGKRLAQANLNF
jgi:hypothetical protein